MRRRNHFQGKGQGQGRKPRSIKLVLLGLLMAGATVSSSMGRADEPRHYTAIEISGKKASSERPYFFWAVALVFRAPHLWVLESEDNEVRIYNQTGDFLNAFGRKGNGPGEFNMPTDLDVLGERVYVADAANRRVQVLDTKGNYLGGFRTDFFPRKILALEEERIVVALLPSGRRGKEKMLHCYTPGGELLWTAHDSYYSGDSVFDTLRNDILLRRGRGGHFYVLGRSEERMIFELDRRGREIRRIAVSDDYPLRKVAIPTGEKGRMRELAAFCWSGDWHEGKFYLAIPDYMDKVDVQPGKSVAVVDERGRVEAFIHFPVAISLLSVSSAGRRFFTLDGEGELRIFEISKR